MEFMAMRRLSKYFLILVALLFVSAAAFAVPVQRVHEIQKPLLSVPAIVKSGEAFELVLKPGAKQVAGAELSGTVMKAYRVALTLDRISADEDTVVFSAAIPQDTPDVLYDLKVTFDDGSTDTQIHSVKVVKEFKKDYDFVHITDIHFNVEKGGDIEDANKVRLALIKDLAKMNVEFVLFSGDLGLNPETYDRDYIYGYDVFAKQMTLPMFMVPGNHEQYVDNRPDEPIDGRPYWDAAYGPTYNSFDYGDIHFVGLNSFDWPKKLRDRFNADYVFLGIPINSNIGPKQWKWFKNDMADASKRGFKEFVIYTHIPNKFLQGGRKMGFSPVIKVKGASVAQFTKLLDHYKVGYVFVGHMHYNRIEKLGKYTTEVWTKAAGLGGGKDSDNPSWGFRIVHVRDGRIAGWDMHNRTFSEVLGR